MQSEERVIREVLTMWERGIDGVVASFEQHCTADLRWCNSGMDDVVGRESCVRLLRAQHRAWHYTGIETDVRQLVVAPGVGVLERTDTIIGERPEALARVAVVGVLEFRGEQIREWRDYFDPVPLSAIASQLRAAGDA